MAAIALALGASLTWGLADFFGPLKGRTFGALRVLVYVQLGGLAAIALIVAIRGRGPADPAALLAIPAAISGTLGLYAYYRGMSVGAMSIVAPIAGISAVGPVAVGIASGDRPSAWQLGGIAAALAGVFLAAREPGRTGARFAAGVGLALLAALGFGGYFPPMHAAGDDPEDHRYPGGDPCDRRHDAHRPDSHAPVVGVEAERARGRGGDRVERAKVGRPFASDRDDQGDHDEASELHVHQHAQRA